MVVRLCAMALAAAALAGCASGGYSGYDSYPDEAYYDGPYDPYYGGGFGSYYDDDFDRYYHPAKNVSCDRVRDICYDRYGPSYHATKRYLGEREANRAYKKYGDSVFLFSPRPGVSCDRRTQECSDGQWTDRAAPDPLKRLERSDGSRLHNGPTTSPPSVSSRASRHRRHRCRTTTTTSRGRHAESNLSSPKRSRG